MCECVYVYRCVYVFVYIYMCVCVCVTVFHKQFFVGIFLSTVLETFKQILIMKDVSLTGVMRPRSKRVRISVTLLRSLLD